MRALSRLSFLALLVCTFFGCTRSEWVAAVGKQRIGKASVDQRLKMLKLVDDKANEKSVTEQLIAFEVRKHILNAKGLSVSDQEVSSLLAQLKKESSKNPRIAQLLNSYEKDPQFKELYLLPQLVEKKASELYEQDTAFHNKELNMVNNLMTRAQAEPNQFEAITKEMGLPFLKGTVDSSHFLITWETSRDVASAPKLPSDQPWFGRNLQEKYLAKTPVGKMVPQAWPIWFGYLVLRHDKTTKEGQSFSVSVLPRKGKNIWEKENSFPLSVNRFKR